MAHWILEASRAASWYSWWNIFATGYSTKILGDFVDFVVSLGDQIADVFFEFLYTKSKLGPRAVFLTV